MDLLFTPRKESVLQVYDEIIKVYRGKEHYLFEVLCAIVPAFLKPDDSREYNTALNSFRSNLNFTSIYGIDRMFKIIQGLISVQYEACDSIILESLIPKLQFETNDAATRIVFNERQHYAAEWTVPVKSFGQDEQHKIQLDLFDYNQNEIVPVYIVEYVKGAVLLYSQGLLKGACALMTIAMETTLRDVLATKGYSYMTGASSDDQYEFSNAVVDLNSSNDKFTISISSGNVKTAADYFATYQGNVRQNVRIKRKKYGQTAKFELSMRDCDNLIDYLSSSTIERPAQKTISGLGAALDIARNQEGLIEMALLPPDMDAIFTGVRNNLIHLSGAGLNNAQIQDHALSEFLSDRNRIFDLINFVPQFINAKFGSLL